MSTPVLPASPAAQETVLWDLEPDEGEASPPSRPGPPRRRVKNPLRDEFDLLADELVQAAGGASSTRRAMREPAARDIVAMGPAVIPLLVERLDQSGYRPLWLRLLGTLTSFQPGAGEETVDDAARAWIRWSKRGGVDAGRP